jgi:hypothetical protein
MEMGIPSILENLLMMERLKQIMITEAGWTSGVFKSFGDAPDGFKKS